MKTIPVGRDKVALVDDEDFDRLVAFNWFWQRRRKTFYASRNLTIGGRHTARRMHEDILPFREGFIRDHKDGNGLNNQKSNLRYCSYSQNALNSIVPRNEVGFRGVSFDPKCKLPYYARIVSNGKRYSLGRFSTAIEAAKAWNLKALELFGEFARLNSL